MLKGIIITEKLISNLLAAKKESQLKKMLSQAVEKGYKIIFISHNINKFCTGPLFNGDVNYKNISVFDLFKRQKKGNKKIDVHEFNGMLDMIKIVPEQDKLLFISDEESDYRFCRCDIDFLLYTTTFINGKKKKPYQQFDRIDKVFEMWHQ